MLIRGNQMWAGAGEQLYGAVPRYGMVRAGPGGYSTSIPPLTGVVCSTRRGPEQRRALNLGRSLFREQGGRGRRHVTGRVEVQRCAGAMENGQGSERTWGGRRGGRVPLCCSNDLPSAGVLIGGDAVGSVRAGDREGEARNVGKQE